MQVVGVVIAFMFREDAKAYLEEGVTKSLAAYGGATNEEEAYTVTLDLAQVSGGSVSNKMLLRY